MSLELSRLFAVSVSVLGLSVFSSSCSSTQDPTNLDGGTENTATESGPTESVASRDAKRGEGLGAGVMTPAAASMQGAGAKGQGTIEAQRKKFLVDQNLEQARRLVAALRFEEAKSALLKAKTYAPERQDVKTLLNQVLEKLGERSGEVGSYADHMARLLEIRIAKDKSDARRLMDEAKKLMERNDYDTAIQKLRKVEIRLEVGVGIDWGTLPKDLTGLMKQAVEEREVAEAAARKEANREAFAKLQLEARRQQARLQRQLDYNLSQGAKAFEQHKFKDARRFADEALALDPTFEEGRELAEASEKAIRNQAKEDYLTAKARAFKQYVVRAEEQKIPYSETFVAPSAKHWQKISALRDSHSDTAKVLAKDPDIMALERKLVSTRLPKGLSYDDENGEYTAVFQNLSTLTGLPILVTPAAKEVIEGNGLILKISLESPLSLKNFLNIMMDRSDKALAYAVRDGAVLITTPADALGKPVVRVHSIRDLTFAYTSFAGPIIRDLPIGAQDDEDKPRSGGEVGERVSFIEDATLQELLKSNIARGTWDGEGGGSMDLASGNLIVVHTPEVQAKVEQFLNDLRKFSTSLVTVESRFLRVERNWLQQFGVDFRGLGGTNAKGTVAQLDDITNGLQNNASRGLDNSGTQDPNGKPISGFYYDDGNDGDYRGRTENYFTRPLGSLLTTNGGASFGLTILDDVQLNVLIRAVEKNQNIQVVDTQSLTVINGNRANISVINQTAYVQDFNVEVAQNAFIADPEVNVIQDGVVLDVRPTISYDRRYITLDLQPTVAELLRPIPTFTTSLSGLTQPVTLMFPQMTVRSASTTVKVPDGGSVLIGGLNESLTRERKAQVPWFANLPLISFLFKEEGSAEENTALMVLVKAYIVNVKARMDSLARRR